MTRTDLDNSMEESLRLLDPNGRDSKQDTGKGGLQEWLQQIVPLTYVLVLMFAVPAQVATFGVAIEIPVLVDSLPEGWALPSYCTLVLQLGNIGPVIYLLLNWLLPGKIKDWAVIYFILVAGGISSLLMAFLWQETSDVAGSEHSTAFLVLLACMSFTDSISAVVFWAYMASFKVQYMSGMFIGQTLGGLIPAVVGLVQGVSDPSCVNTTVNTYDNGTDTNITSYVMEKARTNPRFSASVFFVTLFLIYVMGFVAFSLLQFSPRCAIERTAGITKPTKSELQEAKEQKKRNRRRRRRRRINEDELPLYLVRITPNGLSAECFTELADQLREDSYTVNGNYIQMNSKGEPDRVPQTAITSVIEGDTLEQSESDEQSPSLLRFDMVQLFVVCAFVDGMASCVIPSLASYSCLPYGHSIYGLTVKMMAIAGPMGCVASLFIRDLSAGVISLLTLAATAVASYIIVLAALSPHPPLEHADMGDVLVVSAHMVSMALMMFITVSAASTLQVAGGRKALMWGGSFSQLGSVLGAGLAFLLINVGHVFRERRLDC